MTGQAVMSLTIGMRYGNTILVDVDVEQGKLILENHWIQLERDGYIEIHGISGEIYIVYGEHLMCICAVYKVEGVHGNA